MGSVIGVVPSWEVVQPVKSPDSKPEKGISVNVLGSDARDHDGSSAIMVATRTPDVINRLRSDVIGGAPSALRSS
jgi:hypothetical protein